MKRLTATILAAAMCMGTFAGCGSNTEETTDNSNAGAAAGETAAATTESQTASAENVHLDALNVYFVPSRDPEEIGAQHIRKGKAERPDQRRADCETYQKLCGNPCRFRR